MKNFQLALKGLLAAALSFGLVTQVVAQDAIQGKAKVVRMKGHARFTTGDNVWQPVKVGDVFKQGTVVQTDNKNGSYVDLVLGDGTAPVGSMYSTAPASASASASAAPSSSSGAGFQP